MLLIIQKKERVKISKNFNNFESFGKILLAKYFRIKTMRRFSYTVADPCYKKYVEVDVNACETIRNFKHHISKKLNIREDQFYIKVFTPDHPLNSIDENYTFEIQFIDTSHHIKFNFPDGRTIIVTNADSMEFKDVIKYFAKSENLYFSFNNIKFLLWGIQVPIDGYHLLSVPPNVNVDVRIDIPTITLIYDEKELIFRENDPISNVKKYVKSIFDDNIKVSVKQYPINRILKDNDLLQSDKRYEINATKIFGFVSMKNGHKFYHEMNYLSTVIDAKRMLIASHDDRGYGIENFIIYDTTKIVKNLNKKLNDFTEICFDINSSEDIIEITFVPDESNENKFEPFNFQFDSKIKISDVVKKISERFGIDDEIEILHAEYGTKSRLDSSNNLSDIHALFPDDLLFVKIIKKGKKKISKSKFRPVQRHISDEKKMFTFEYKDTTKSCLFDKDSCLIDLIPQIKNLFGIKRKEEVLFKIKNGATIEDQNISMQTFKDDVIIKIYLRMVDYSFKLNNNETIHHVSLEFDANLLQLKNKIVNELKFDDVTKIEVYLNDGVLNDDSALLYDLNINDSVLIVNQILSSSPRSRRKRFASSAKFKPVQRHISDEKKMFTFEYKDTTKSCLFDKDSCLIDLIPQIKNLFGIKRKEEVLFKIKNGATIEDQNISMQTFEDDAIIMIYLKVNTYSFKVNGSDVIHHVRLNYDSNLLQFKLKIAFQLKIDDLTKIEVYLNDDILNDDSVLLDSLNINDDSVLIFNIKNDDKKKLFTFEYKGIRKSCMLEKDQCLVDFVPQIKKMFRIYKKDKIAFKTNEDIPIDDLDISMDSFANDAIIKIYLKERFYSFKMNGIDGVHHVFLDANADLLQLKNKISVALKIEDLTKINVYFDDVVLNDDKLLLDSLNIYDSVLIVDIQSDDRAFKSDYKIIFLSDDFMNQLLPQIIDDNIINSTMSATTYKVNCIDVSSLAFNPEKKEFFALKILKGKLATKDDSDDTFNVTVTKIKYMSVDYEILAQLNHPNIIHAFGIFYGNKSINPCILFECFGITLDDFIKKSFSPDDNNNNEVDGVDLVAIIYEIATAMKYVHSLGITHLNLTPSSIFIDFNKHAKIGGFDMSSVIYDDSISFDSMAYDHAYCAPEIADDIFDEKTDVFSFGVVVHFIITHGNLPTIADSKPVFKQKLNGIAKKLICECLSFDPAKRPTFDVIINYIMERKFNLISGIEYQIGYLNKFLGLHHE